MMSYFDLQRWLRGGSVLLCVVATSAAQGGIIAHYKFDETMGNTAFNEIAENGGNGVIGANVTKGVTGVNGGTAFRLPGTPTSPNINPTAADIVDMGSDATDIFQKINMSGALTISYWLQATETPRNRNVAISLGSTANNNSYVDSGLRGDGTFAGRVYGRNRANKTMPVDIGDIAGPVVTNGMFHHIALTVDIASKTGSFYVDGELALSETDPLKYGAFPLFNDFEVGRLVRSGPVDPFKGVIDDLQLYDSALTASQVGYLFNNPGQVVPEPAAFVLLVGALGLVACRRWGKP